MPALLSEVSKEGSSFILSLDPDLLISILFQWLNTAILIAALALLLYRPVKGFLARRADRIRKQIEDADANRAEAEALRA
ncbi:MAG: hypothetical protein FWE68_06990, partial [Defluviitaleaceae bacterium]|nr:hypothetical protein [Defluviitaleaceae bacterium]